MNKKEKDVICALIADWEWSEAKGASEAAGIASCARHLRTDLSVSDDDLAFYRAWTIGERCNDQSEEFVNKLCDMIDDNGYTAFVDAIERYDNWELFAGFVRAGIDDDNGNG